jgi:3-phenylpropionate/trans-cinnamate dioxygenase ferredoxin reductase component
MTGDAAVRGIRQIDARPTHRIDRTRNQTRPITARRFPKVYGNPARAPCPWRVSGEKQKIWESICTWGAKPSGWMLNKQVTDDQGDEYTFDRLLLATGGDPIRLKSPSGELPADRVIYFRTLADYHRIRALTEQHQRFAVIGGGFIGSEMAAALSGLGKEVVIIFPEDGICARVLPPAVSQHLVRVFRDRGIRVLAGHMVQALQQNEKKITIHTDQGESVDVDGVVAGLGIRPNTALAADSGLIVEDGIQVDDHLRTSHPDIYAAGDVANFYNPTLEKRMRVEHEENANIMGQLAGQNMAGASNLYHHLPSVYSTLFQYSYDAVGELDPAAEMVFDWQEPLQKGTVYYLKQGRVRGVLLWNVSRGLDTARQLIAAPGPIHPEDLHGKITG